MSFWLRAFMMQLILVLIIFASSAAVLIAFPLFKTSGFPLYKDFVYQIWIRGRQRSFVSMESMYSIKPINIGCLSEQSSPSIRTILQNMLV